MNDKIKLTKQRIKFIETYGDMDDFDTLKELLYASQVQIDKLEKIRSNTSILAWWLVAIPLIIGLLYVAGNIV